MKRAGVLASRRQKLAFPFAIGCILFLAAITAGAQNILLDIGQALTRALRSNDALKYARLDYTFEAARYRMRLREYLPAVTIGYMQDDEVMYYGPDSRLRQLSIGVDQLLYAGGARLQEHRSVADRLRIREKTVEQMEKELRLDVINRYVEILKLGLQIRILAESLSMAREQAAVAAEELNLGEITRLDFVDIELTVQDLEIELAVVKQEEERLKFELKELLGIAPTETLELTGVINPDFRGMLPDLDAGHYVQYAAANSLELEEHSVEVSARNRALLQARRVWLPRMSTQVELCVTGERFPLTDPGFSVGVNFDFSTPVVPFHTAVTAGGRGTEERTLGLSSTAEIGENLTGLQSPRIARIGLRKAETELQSAQRILEHSIRQQLTRRSFLLEALRLEEKRLALESEKSMIEALMLDIGEITRLEYLQSGITFARRKVDQLSRIVSLFQMEAVLLAQCGFDMFERSHEFILLTAAEESW